MRLTTRGFIVLLTLAWLLSYAAGYVTARSMQHQTVTHITSGVPESDNP